MHWLLEKVNANLAENGYYTEEELAEFKDLALEIFYG